MKKYYFVILTKQNSPIIKGELLAINEEDAWDKAKSKLAEYKLQSNNFDLKIYMRFD